MTATASACTVSMKSSTHAGRVPEEVEVHGERPVGQGSNAAQAVSQIIAGPIGGRVEDAQRSRVGHGRDHLRRGGQMHGAAHDGVGDAEKPGEAGL